jgi:signal transduction histidine kinase
MGGTVNVDSIEGQGTTFKINLSMQAKMLTEKEKELNLL